MSLLSRRHVLASTVAGIGALALAPTASASTATLTTRLSAIDNAMVGSMAVGVHDLRTGTRTFYNSGFHNYCASIVKVLILSTVCFQAQQQGRLLNATEKSQATAMICHSDNDAATWLWNSVGGASVVQAMANRLGMTSTQANVHWGLTTTSVSDQLLLLDEIFVNGRWINTSKRSFIQQLMSAVGSDQRWGVGSVGTSAVKNGWLQHPSPWIVNSVGYTTGAGRNYTVATLTSTASMSLGVSIVNQIAAAVYADLATPLH